MKHQEVATSVCCGRSWYNYCYPLWLIQQMIDHVLTLYVFFFFFQETHAFFIELQEIQAQFISSLNRKLTHENIQRMPRPCFLKYDCGILSQPHQKSRQTSRGRSGVGKIVNVLVSVGHRVCVTVMNSANLVGDSSHGQHINKQAWLCCSKTLFTKKMTGNLQPIGG